MSDTPFSTDSLLHYNVGEWRQYGLAVPNCDKNTHSNNATIREIVSLIGRTLQHIMFHWDARTTAPPSINTLTRIHRLINRGRSLIAGRTVNYNEPGFEPIHASPVPEVHLVYPTPCFTVRNPHLKSYCQLALQALTEAMQHSENAAPTDITPAFAGAVGQYLQRIYVRMAVELFLVDPKAARQPDFMLTSAQLNSYDPTRFFTSVEMTDSMPPIRIWPTERDMKVLALGVPVTELPMLGAWDGSTFEFEEAALARASTSSTASPVDGPTQAPAFVAPVI